MSGVGSESVSKLKYGTKKKTKTDPNDKAMKAYFNKKEIKLIQSNCRCYWGRRSRAWDS